MYSYVVIKYILLYIYNNSCIVIVIVIVIWYIVIYVEFVCLNLKEREFLKVREIKVREEIV